MQNEPSLTLLTVSFWFCTINAQLFTHISTVEVNTFKIDSSRLFLCVIQLLILFYLCFCIETSEQCNQFVVCIDTKPEREGLSCVGCKMVVVWVLSADSCQTVALICLQSVFRQPCLFGQRSSSTWAITSNEVTCYDLVWNLIPSDTMRKSFFIFTIVGLGRFECDSNLTGVFGRLALWKVGFNAIKPGTQAKIKGKKSLLACDAWL